jgi:predicted O-methyltransferase YrrM
VHSPFVFDFINQVLRSREKDSSLSKIEIIRKNLLKDHRVIKVDDAGAGSRIMRSDERKISGIALSSLMREKHARLMNRMVNYFKSEKILELGTSLGITTMYLASAKHTTHITTVEGSKAIYEIAVENFRKNGFRNITAHNAYFDDVLTSLLSSTKFHLVIIDGNHRKEPTLKYFNEILLHSLNETVLIFDDIHWSEEMEEAWKLIRDDSRVTVTIDIFFMGIVFLRKELHKENFVLRYP